jgi:prepilin-type N-terminal cleavage/methylation domain-containing protein
VNKIAAMKNADRCTLGAHDESSIHRDDTAAACLDHAALAKREVLAEQHGFTPVKHGFTLIDILVSIAIIAVLIGILLPSLASVNEAARRVICQSNVRQIGYGLVMYANDFNGQLPSSRFTPVQGNGNMARESGAPEKMVTLRVPLAAGEESSKTSGWDGLGLLYPTGYLTAAKVFYCPSHRGETRYSNFALSWDSPTIAQIDCNYHFRGEGPTSVRSNVTGEFLTTSVLWNIDPAQSSLIADSMRAQADYNHKVGVNFFRADLSVHWFNDPSGSLRESLPLDKTAAYAQPVLDAWNSLDQSANAEPR